MTGNAQLVRQVIKFLAIITFPEIINRHRGVLLHKRRIHNIEPRTERISGTGPEKQPVSVIDTLLRHNLHIVWSELIRTLIRGVKNRIVKTIVKCIQGIRQHQIRLGLLEIRKARLIIIRHLYGLIYFLGSQRNCKREQKPTGYN